MCTHKNPHSSLLQINLFLNNKINVFKMQTVNAENRIGSQKFSNKVTGLKTYTF